MPCVGILDLSFWGMAHDGPGKDGRNYSTVEMVTSEKSFM